MKLFKCTFSVGAEKFLRFVVHNDGISIYANNADAVLKIEPLKEPKTTQ